MLAALAASALAASVSAAAVDWSAVEGREVVLFPPGQSSFEWMLVESEHSGGPKIRTGKTCSECHAGEEREIGRTIASGEKLEPDPVPGQRPAVPVTLKTVHDGERLFVRLEWPAAEGSPERAGGAEHRVQAALMLTDEAVRAAELTGCWATCHDDLVAMPSDPPDAELTKYLGTSRTQMSRSGGGTSTKAPGELQQLLAQGAFMEYWQVRVAPDGAAETIDGHVLEERHLEESSPLVSGSAELRDGRWVVVLSRPLATERTDRKTLAPGKTYTFGLAIHEQHTEGRHHHVSLEHTLRLDEGEADFVARRH